MKLQEEFKQTRIESLMQELLCDLENVGDGEPLREGLKESPARIAKAMLHWFGGYEMEVADVLKTFEDGASGVDQMVAVVDIPFYSHCEHHMAPILGVATIAYIPNGRIVGLSKLKRLLDVFARRLQVQERLTQQIADAIQEELNPLGVGVKIKARHLCMESRGVEQRGHYTVTTALYGAIKEETATRAEFMALGDPSVKI